MMKKSIVVRAACRHLNFPETPTEQTPMIEKYKNYPDRGNRQRPLLKIGQEGDPSSPHAGATGTHFAIMEGG